MELGVVFPQTEIGPDPADCRAYAERAEELGFTHMHAYDHVVGANPDRPGYDGPYDYTDQFHEPFALFSYLGAHTDDIEFVTGILILPQRQTALVAKQAAEVDLLTGGRLALGVGVGWNDVEYEALDADFHTRGRRIEEQIALLRRLWQEELVDFDGTFHRIPNAGLNPLPVQRPIPILMGGGAEPVLKRAGRLAEGWLSPGTWKTADADLEALADVIDEVRGYHHGADADPDAFEIRGRMSLERDDPEEWIERTRQWAETGATHLGIDTMNMGLASPAEHISIIERYADVLADAGIPIDED